MAGNPHRTRSIGRRRLVGIVLAGFAAAFVWASRSPGTEPAPGSPLAEAAVPAARPLDEHRLAPAHPQPQFVGVSSCAASNCHGGGGATGTHGSEYSVWIQRDPHAQAYSVLWNDLSADIAKRLNLETEAHRTVACLSCHSPNVAVAPFVDDHHGARTDGVGCEACHGAASQWLGPHVRLDWKNKSAGETQQLGFVDTRHIPTRARVCATCHVGARGRDVNHDLIAAGHPRLNFEFGAFHANTPHHWDDREDHARNASQPGHSYLEAKLWAVGQVTAAEAALNLLEHRAADANAVWPEFSEYGCFACHHDLATPSWRQQQATAGQQPSAERRPGSSAWGTWYFSVLPTLDAFDRVDTKDAVTTLRLLQLELEQPFPNREHVRTTAGQARRQLVGWSDALERETYSTDALAAMLQRFSAEGPAVFARNWDAAVQLYLAMVALNQGYHAARYGTDSAVQTDEQEINAALEAIRRRLGYPRGFDSPKHYSPSLVDDITHDLGRVREQIDAD